MSVNFFEEKCQEVNRTDNLFGLCDDQNGTKAYSNIDDKSRWIATVKNENKLNVLFTAVDKCVIKDNEEVGKERCDGMLTYREHLYFVELENKRKDWITEAITQLESTIKVFLNNHDGKEYRYKKAFACSKKHPSFQTIDNELNKRFFRTYGFRIDVQAEIIIK